MLRTYGDYTGAIDGMNNNAETTYSFKSPFWSGINLHLQYTGLQNLTVTFHNNVSFTGVKGGKDRLVHPLGYARLQPGPITDTKEAYEYLEENENQDWFAMYNGLHFAYKVTDRLSAHLMLQNRFSDITKMKDGAKDPGSVTSDYFSSAALVSYALGNVLIEGGLVFRNISHEWADGVKGNVSYFAIPLRTRITF
jgi:hypothetical protein